MRKSDRKVKSHKTRNTKGRQKKKDIGILLSLWKFLRKHCADTTTGEEEEDIALSARPSAN
jgi:hypothetical protein